MTTTASHCWDAGETRHEDKGNLTAECSGGREAYKLTCVTIRLRVGQRKQMGGGKNRDSFGNQSCRWLENHKQIDSVHTPAQCRENAKNLCAVSVRRGAMAASAPSKGKAGTRRRSSAAY